MLAAVDGSNGCQCGAFGRLHGLHEDVAGLFQRRKRHVVAVGIQRVADGAAARVGARVGDGAGDGEIQFGRAGLLLLLLATLDGIIDRKASAGRGSSAAAAASSRFVLLGLDGAQRAECVAAADGRHGGRQGRVGHFREFRNSGRGGIDAADVAVEVALAVRQRRVLRRVVHADAEAAAIRFTCQR